MFGIILSVFQLLFIVLQIIFLILENRQAKKTNYRAANTVVVIIQVIIKR